MRIICLAKRRPQGRDLFTQPYGRFHHLPNWLAEAGHEVHIMLLSYRNEPEAYRQLEKLHVYSFSALPWGPWRYIRQAHRLASRVGPDWIIGFSDTWFGILAELLASQRGARSLIDAYDNYESYMPWAKPLHMLWRRALVRADAVTAAGPQLAVQIGATPDRGGVVAMAADPIFGPQDKATCRARLGLPLDKVLVGYTGALHSNRGINLLFDVYARLRALNPDIRLVLSGRQSAGIHLPADAYWLGYRSPEEVPAIVNSLDLQFVLNTPGAFGNYSYPSKLYEAMACGIPVVAADVPGTAWVLRDHPEMLAQPGNVDDFVSKATSLLGREHVKYGQLSTWEESARALEIILSTSQPAEARRLRPTISG